MFGIFPIVYYLNNATKDISVVRDVLVVKRMCLG